MHNEIFSMRQVREMARGDDKARAAALMVMMIDSPEQMTEFLHLYYADGPQPLANQVKQALSLILRRFDDSQRKRIPHELARHIPGWKRLPSLM